MQALPSFGRVFANPRSPGVVMIATLANSGRATGPRWCRSLAIPASFRRLYEFGLLEGEEIELVALAPLGDPIEIRLGNTRLSLRRSEAADLRPQSCTGTCWAIAPSHPCSPRRSPSHWSAIPNTGKSTLFNALSGLRQRVGNYPGVTVEMKKGQFSVDGTHDRPHRLARHLQPGRAKPRRDGRRRSLARPQAGRAAAGCRALHRRCHQS